MARTGTATPGEYASAKSRCVAIGFEATISILPGRPREWNSSASASVYLTLLSDMERGLSPAARKESRDDPIESRTPPIDRLPIGHGPSRRSHPYDGSVSPPQ